MTTENETKQAILNVATRLFGVHGMDSVSTTEIAEAAGINKALIFYYFESKENLYREVFTSLIQELAGEMQAALSKTPPGIAAIERFVRAHINFLRTHRYLVGFIVRELLEVRAGKDRLFNVTNTPLKMLRDKLLGMITEARAMGEIRDVDPLQTAVNILSLDVFFFLGKPLVEVIAEGTDVELFEQYRVDHVVDLLMNGLRKKEEPS